MCLFSWKSFILTLAKDGLKFLELSARLETSRSLSQLLWPASGGSIQIPCPLFGLVRLSGSMWQSAPAGTKMFHFCVFEWTTLWFLKQLTSDWIPFNEDLKFRILKCFYKKMTWWIMSKLLHFHSDIRAFLIVSTLKTSCSIRPQPWTRRWPLRPLNL